MAAWERMFPIAFFFLFCLLLAFFLLNGSWLKPSFVALKGKDKYMTPVVSLECWHIAKNADSAPVALASDIISQERNDNNH